MFTLPMVQIRLIIILQVVPPKDVSMVISGYPGCMQVIQIPDMV